MWDWRWGCGSISEAARAFPVYPESGEARGSLSGALLFGPDTGYFAKPDGRLSTERTVPGLPPIASST
jgi:hypothetical protein